MKILRIDPIALSRSLAHLIFAAFLVCCIGTIAFSQTVTPVTTQGYPAVSTLETTSNGNTITAIVPSSMALDASQFPGAPDICAQINAAYTSSAFTGTIDATAFSGIQECVSNPFHIPSTATLKTVHLFLNPNVTIVTSVPWFTPQVTHSIEGRVAGNIGSNANAIVGGATILACGPTISLGLTGLSFVSGQCQYTSSSGSFTVNQFPDTTAADTVVMSFAYPHGPFPAGTYSCILCVGGEGNVFGSPAQEGLGWNQDGDASRISGIKLDLGGNTNIFGYYTVNSQERAELLDTRGGPACGTTSSSANCADVFYDRSEAPIGSGTNPNAGTTRPVIRDFNMAGEAPSACTSCYAIAFEGSDYLVQITKGNCDSPPIAYINGVQTGMTTTITGAVVNNGSGNCDTMGVSHEPVCTVQAAPQLFGVSSHVLSGIAMGYPSFGCTFNFGTNHVINTINITLNSGKINNSFFTGGPLFEDINIDPQSTFKNGLWIEGVNNAEISKVHCLTLSDYCVSFGGVSPNSPPTAAFTPAGIIRNIDINAGTHGAVTLGYGIDNGQVLESLSSGATYLVQDLYNGVNLATNTYGNTLNQYTPGSAPNAVGGVGLQGANARNVVNVSGGAGGAAIPQETGNGNMGGGISLSTGVGSIGGTTSGNGGAGGTFSVTAGNGGAATATSVSNGGSGGSLNFAAGNGAAGGSTGTGGPGGNIVLTPGTGGTGGTAGGSGSVELVTTTGSGWELSGTGLWGPSTVGGTLAAGGNTHGVVVSEGSGLAVSTIVGSSNTVLLGGTADPSFGAVPNSALVNSSLTISVTGPITGGGSVALGGTSTALACSTCVTSSGGGAITGTPPISVSPAGVVSITSPLPVANGGTGLSSGTSGGVLGYTASGTLASSSLLATNAIVQGGGLAATPTTGNGDFTIDATAHTLKSGSLGLVDFSAISSTSGFKVPSHTTNSAAAAGVIDYDSSANNLHANVNSADSVVLAVPTSPSLPNNNVVPKYVVSSSNVTQGSSSITDTGSTLSTSDGTFTINGNNSAQMLCTNGAQSPVTLSTLNTLQSLITCTIPGALMATGHTIMPSINVRETTGFGTYPVSYELTLGNSSSSNIIFGPTTTGAGAPAPAISMLFMACVVTGANAESCAGPTWVEGGATPGTIPNSAFQGVNPAATTGSSTTLTLWGECTLTGCGGNTAVTVEQFIVSAY